MKWGLLCCITNTIAADGLESAMSYGIWSIDIDLSLRPEYYGVGIIKKRIVTILYETKIAHRHTKYSYTKQFHDYYYCFISN